MVGMEDASAEAMALSAIDNEDNQRHSHLESFDFVVHQVIIFFVNMVSVAVR